MKAIEKAKKIMFCICPYVLFFWEETCQENTAHSQQLQKITSIFNIQENILLESHTWAAKKIKESVDPYEAWLFKFWHILRCPKSEAADRPQITGKKKTEGQKSYMHKNQGRSEFVVTHIKALAAFSCRENAEADYSKFKFWKKKFRSLVFKRGPRTQTAGQHIRFHLPQIFSATKQSAQIRREKNWKDVYIWTSSALTSLTNSHRYESSKELGGGRGYCVILDRQTGISRVRDGFGIFSRLFVFQKQKKLREKKGI